MNDKSVESRAALWKVLYLALCFAIVFTSNIVQSFLTTLYGSYGYIALALLQLFFGIGSLFAPVIVNIFGVKSTMVFGSLTYFAMLSIVTFKIGWLLISMAIVNGVGAAFLWISQGIWLTRITENSGSIGTLTGVFFAVFNMNAVIGNTLAIILQNFAIPLETIIWVMSAVALVGSLMMVFSSSVPNLENKATMNSTSVLQTLADLKRVFIMKKTLLLLPYILCQGVSASFWAADIPVFAEGNEKLIIYIMLSFGIAATISSFICGKINDRFGATPILVTHFIVGLLQFGILTLIILPSPVRLIVPSQTLLASLLIFLGAMYGLQDFLINTVVNVSISRYYSADSMPVAFSIYRLIGCVAFAVSAAISAFIPDLLSVCINLTVTVVCIICYVWFLREATGDLATHDVIHSKDLTEIDVI